MRSISVLLCALAGMLVFSPAYGQCRGGGASATAGTSAGGVSAGGLVATGGGSALLTGPGSLAYDMMMAQAIQRQLAQRQYLLAMERAAEREQKLAQRRVLAERQRAQIADSRRRTREQLAAKNGTAPPSKPAAYVAWTDSGRK
jgi:hypothetical protein